jgi:hypothetical protein
MIKPELLFAALIAAAVLTTPATARQSQMTSQRVTANANALSRRAGIMRTCKPAAVIALAISVVLPSGTRGATGAPITGQWFPLCLKPRTDHTPRGVAAVKPSSNSTRQHNSGRQGESSWRSPSGLDRGVRSHSPDCDPTDQARPGSFRRPPPLDCFAEQAGLDPRASRSQLMF